MNPFQPGDVVIRRTGGAPFTVHIASDAFSVPPMRAMVNQPGVCDVHLNWVKSADCVLFSVYNSPLWAALHEEKVS